MCGCECAIISTFLLCFVCLNTFAGDYSRKQSVALSLVTLPQLKHASPHTTTECNITCTCTNVHAAFTTYSGRKQPNAHQARRSIDSWGEVAGVQRSIQNRGSAGNLDEIGGDFDGIAYVSRCVGKDKERPQREAPKGNEMRSEVIWMGLEAMRLVITL